MDAGADKVQASGGERSARLIAEYRRGFGFYSQGLFAEALQVWEPVLKELGPHVGFRVAHAMGLCLARFKKANEAAEHLAMFVSEYEARKAVPGGDLQPEDALRAKESAEEIEKLNKAYGRIRVARGDWQVPVQIGKDKPRAAPFTIYVEPGTYPIVFGPGHKFEVRQSMKVDAGQVIEPKFPEPPTRTEKVTVKPFPVSWVYVNAGVALASWIAPPLLYMKTNSLRREYENSRDVAERQSIEQSYSGWKTSAYAALGISIGLTVVATTVLTWYFVGATEKEVRMRVGLFAAPEQGGSQMGVLGTF